MSKAKKNLIIAGLIVGFWGCAHSPTEPVAATDIEASAALAEVATEVILATYSDLAEKADTLSAAVARFNVSSSQVDLDSAKQAWRNARRPWEQSEAFIFGPVATQGIDPSIDSWPVNKTDLDAVLASSDVLTKTYIDAQEGTLKGFHTIEYLLFGQGNTKTAGDFDARQKEYLAAVTASFSAATDSLRAWWLPTGGNYVSHFKLAGQAGSLYPTQRAAMQELINGMIGICDEVANGKINDPYTQGDRTLEESQFSDNSNADFADNIRSVQNVYLGSYGAHTGEGVFSFVASKNTALDTRLKTEIAAAISAIGEMTPSFGQAIFTNKTKVDAALAAIQKIQATLEGDVLPLVTE